MSTDLIVLQDELERLTTQRDIADRKVEISELTAFAEQGRIVLEAWGDRIDPREYLHDDPNFSGRYAAPISLADDRRDGRYWPIFRNEQDLAFIRGAAHVMTTSFGSALNILENLTNYTIAEGFTHEVKPDSSDTPRELVAAGQRVLDTFFDDNDWKSDLERELHWRSREDGEAALLLRPRGWRTRASFVESDWITEPADPYELEAWLSDIGRPIGCEVAGDFVSSWSFGVHTRANDCGRPLGYHVVFDGSGRDWEYFPSSDVVLAKQLGSGVLEFIKRNVPRNVKRGVSDFYPVLSRLERSEKLSVNLETTSAIQAAIAFIREHVPTATNTQISSLRSSASTQTYQKTLPDGTQRKTYRQKFEPGTIVDTNGTKYIHGPAGQSNAPNYIEVIQSALRSTGSRWLMTEYMISADASNANFASTMVAGAPFIKAREADQRFYASRFYRIDWLVMRIAYEGGYFDRFDLNWDQLEMLLEIEVTPPDITIADELKQAQVKEIEHRNRVLSSKTWRKETGRDEEIEAAALDEEQKQGMGPQEPQGRTNLPAVAPAAANQPATAQVAGAPMTESELSESDSGTGVEVSESELDSARERLSKRLVSRDYP